MTMTMVAESRRALPFTAAAAAASVLLLLLSPLTMGTVAAAGSDRGCTRICGNISIPFPFGVEPGCHIEAEDGFNLTCDHSHRPPKLFIGDGTVQVLAISVPNATVRVNTSRVVFTADGGAADANGTWGAGLPRNGPYFLSSEATSSVAVLGCGVRVDVRGGRHDHLLGSCTAVCPLVPDDDHGGGIDGGCTGVSCCQANIVPISSFYDIKVHRIDDNTAAASTDSDYSVYIVDGVFSYSGNDKDRPEALPATLDWVIRNSTCSANASAPACLSANSFCRNSTAVGHGESYLCHCSKGYQGNPYVIGGCQDIDECNSSGGIRLCYGDCKNTEGAFNCQCPAGFHGNARVPDGCKDIDECADPVAHSCYGSCLNFPGSFHCECPNGTYGFPFKKGGCITIKKSFTGLSIGLGVGGGTSLLLLALGAPFIARKIKLRKAERIKARFFKQNHGLLLQQLISQKSDIGTRMIIPLRQIEKATNKFDASHQVGGGGHGVVYKGLLDLQVVAIKKSKIVVQREIDEFINEVAILSQINHRNVVKLLGCCLETEVPLLVYEFISNGTLEHHLHINGPISLSWGDRFRIALEVSKAIAYLHSAASTPILHRDIKSSNILLDDNLTAKVSDFGASKYIPIDQNGVTTAVQGTIGYLDPMYYYKGRLTDKSDVYSFGVLLIELITRKKPSMYRSNDGEGIVSHFASLLDEGKLVDIIDPAIMEEDGQVREVAELAVTCTNLNGEYRPTMREVEMTLENLRVIKETCPPHNMSFEGLSSKQEGNIEVLSPVTSLSPTKRYTCIDS